MTALVAALALLFAAIAQGRLPAPDLLGHARWPLFSGIVLYYALRRDGVSLLLVAALAGLLQDAGSAVPLGYSSFCFLVMAAAIWRVRAQLMTDAVVTQMFFGAAAGCLLPLVQYGWLMQADLLAVGLWPALLRVAGGGVAGLVVAPLVCRLLDVVERGVGNVKMTSEVEGSHGDLVR